MKTKTITCSVEQFKKLIQEAIMEVVRPEALRGQATMRMRSQTAKGRKQRPHLLRASPLLPPRKRERKENPKNFHDNGRLDVKISNGYIQGIEDRESGKVIFIHDLDSIQKMVVPHWMIPWVDGSHIHKGIKIRAIGRVGVKKDYLLVDKVIGFPKVWSRKVTSIMRDMAFVALDLGSKDENKPN